MSEITHIRGEPDDIEPLLAERTAELLTRVGERVRKARDRKGIPRRVLAEISGVSPRYLAQIEAGEGNISIALLLRVAAELDCQMEWLTGVEDPWTSNAYRVAELYRRASDEVRERVLAELSPLTPEARKSERIALIGLRGAGKSTLGARLGKALSLPFVELNHDIEEQAGMPVAEVMAFYGQDGYRRLENQALERVAATHTGVVLAVAGGIVAEPETFHTLLSMFHTVWLKATPEEHMERVRAQGDLRPMKGKPEAMEQLRALLKARETLYEKAEAELDTSGKAVEASSEELERLVRAREWLQRP